MSQLQTSAIRKRRKSRKTEGVYDDGYLRVEYENYYVAVGRERLKLGRAEFCLISILTREKDCYVPAELVWRHLWTASKKFNAKSLRVFICRLRRQLAPFGISIESMINAGYRLFLPESSN